MSKLVLPKSTTVVREGATPIEGEIFYDKDTQAVYFGDGATAGGVSLRSADLDAAYVYGIDHDIAIPTAASACQKVVLNHDHDQAGDALRYTQVVSFAQMPAHNFRRCVMPDLANRTVAYYLNPSDSRKKENGQASVLTGADGDVMVEIPVGHYRIDTYTDLDSHVHFVYLVSNKAFNGSKPHPFFYTSPGGATLRTQYVGAFRDVLCDAAGLPKTQPDAHTPATYAAGDRFRSIAGSKPHGSATRAVFRAGAASNGATNTNGLMDIYLFMMMAIDAGTFNSQTLSIGYTYLSEFDYGAVRKTGRTAVFGNTTGNLRADDATSEGIDYDLLSMASGGVSLWNAAAQAEPLLKVIQFSYRGIEDPFGSQWVFCDGMQKYQNATNFLQSGYWVTNDTERYALTDSDLGAGPLSGVFPESGYTGAGLAWIYHEWPKAKGYIGQFDPKNFFPITLGGSSTTYLCDYYVNNGDAGARGIIRGGSLQYENDAGAGYTYVINPLGDAVTGIGCRLGA